MTAPRPFRRHRANRRLRNDFLCHVSRRGYGEFDITELSLSNAMSLLARGASAYVAIPVFPLRLFRHSSICIRADRGIAGPQDLRGKIIGVAEYPMTVAVWIRGILQDQYGVRATDIK